MRLLSKALMIGGLAIAVVGGAEAAPSFVNPNFVPTNGSTTGPGYYTFTGGTDGWTTGGTSINTGYAVSSPFFDNGLPQNGANGVGFIQSAGTFLEQSVSGLTIGSSYSVSVLANSSALFANYYGAGAALNILADGVLIFSGQIANVNPAGTNTAGFNALTSSTFTALTTSETIRFVLGAALGTANGGGDVPVDLTGATFNSVGANAEVPEPMSIALLTVGIVGGLAARRRASAQA